MWRVQCGGRHAERACYDRPTAGFLKQSCCKAGGDAANHFEALESPLEIYVAPAEFVYNASPQPVKTSLDWYVELWDR